MIYDSVLAFKSTTQLFLCILLVIYGFEVLSSTEWSSAYHSSFNPKTFVDISKHFKIKIDALKAYEEEMRDPPHTRSIKHAEVLAQHRGFNVGIFLAEAFEVYRMIR